MKQCSVDNSSKYVEVSYLSELSPKPQNPKTPKPQNPEAKRERRARAAEERWNIIFIIAVGSFVRSVDFDALVALAALDLALDELLAEIVELEVGELAVGGVDGDLHGLAIGLLLLDFLDVDAPLLPVHGEHLADLVFEIACGGDLRPLPRLMRTSSSL